MLTIEQILESITEAIRLKRRYGPKFPTVFDAAQVLYDVTDARIELDLMDNGKLRKFDLFIEEVEEHGPAQDGEKDE